MKKIMKQIYARMWLAWRLLRLHFVRMPESGRWKVAGAVIRRDSKKIRTDLACCYDTRMNWLHPRRTSQVL